MLPTLSIKPGTGVTCFMTALSNYLQSWIRPTYGVVTWTYLALCAVIALLSFGCSRATSPKNIILITVDTLRSDRLGCYGYPHPTTPAVDHFAEDALLFEKAYAQASSTCPSIAALITSRMPSEVGVHHNRHRLGKGFPTLAEVLSENGFTTAAFISNFVLRKGTGFERGFDIYNDSMTSHESNRKLLERRAESTTDDVISWLETCPKEPFFLWVHYQDPHGPYTPPTSYSELFLEELDVFNIEIPLNADNSGVSGIPLYQHLEEKTDLRSYIARYLGEIRYFDDSFGRLLQKLKEIGLYTSSLIVFTSDHGESLGEHDHFFAHGEYLYQDQILVPLIIRAPGQSADRITVPVSLLDLYPTFLGLVGVNGKYVGRGIDLLKNRRKERPIFAQTFKAKYISRNRQSMICGNYKIINSGRDEYEVYNLLDDPMELRDIKEIKPELADSLRNIFQQFFSRFKKGSMDHNAEELELDEETLKKLESLGYW